MNCFPGTCHNGNDTCICVSGFGGTNCNTSNDMFYFDLFNKYRCCDNNMNIFRESSKQENMYYYVYFITNDVNVRVNTRTVEQYTNVFLRTSEK